MITVFLKRIITDFWRKEELIFANSVTRRKFKIFENKILDTFIDTLIRVRGGGKCLNGHCIGFSYSKGFIYCTSNA